MAIHLQIPVHDPRVHDVLDWWRTACGDRAMPARGDIEPLAFPRSLPIVWLSEYLPEAATYRFRLAGEEVRASNGRPMKGRTIQEVFPENKCPHILRVYEQVARTPAIYHRQGQVYTSQGRVGTGERLMLPLGLPGQGTTHILGVTAYRLESAAIIDGLGEVSFARSAPRRQFYPVGDAALSEESANDTARAQ